MAARSQNPPEKMMFQLTLRRRGISDQAVLRAMEEVPREAFVEAGRSRRCLSRQRARHRLRPDHQPALRGGLHDRAAAAAEAAPRARDRHRLRLPGRDPVAALPARPDHRALPDAGRQRPGAAGKARLRQCRGDARGRLRHPGRRRQFRPHHRHRGDGADPGEAAAAARARRHPDRAGRAASGHPDPGPRHQDRRRFRPQGAGRRALRAGAAGHRPGTAKQYFRIGCFRQHLIPRVKRLFTREVFTQNSNLLRTSE